MNCMNHPSAKKQTAIGYSLLCLEFLHMFGSVLLLQRRLLLMAPTFPSWPFWIFITLMLTEEYSGHAGKWQAGKPYPERSPCTLLQEAVFTPLAGCGAYHQEVSPFLWVAKPLGGRDCREDAFQGVWGQPTWLHRWMTVRPWAMCLLGAFCSGRNASSMRAVDGTSDAY